MFNYPERPPVQTAASTLDFMRLHNPVLAITWCTQNPSDYQALSRGKRELLITLAQEHQMPHEAWLLTCLQGPAPNPLIDSADMPALNARFHLMRNVLFNIKTSRSLLDLVEEQLLLAQDHLGDMVNSDDDPGISETDELRLEELVTKLHTLDDDLSELSEHYRDLVGLV